MSAWAAQTQPIFKADNSEAVPSGGMAHVTGATTAGHQGQLHGGSHGHVGMLSSTHRGGPEPQPPEQAADPAPKHTRAPTARRAWAPPARLPQSTALWGALQAPSVGVRDLAQKWGPSKQAAQLPSYLLTQKTGCGLPNGAGATRRATPVPDPGDITGSPESCWDKPRITEGQRALTET